MQALNCTSRNWEPEAGGAALYCCGAGTDTCRRGYTVSTPAGGVEGGGEGDCWSRVSSNSVTFLLLLLLLSVRRARQQSPDDDDDVSLQAGSPIEGCDDKFSKCG